MFAAKWLLGSANYEAVSAIKREVLIEEYGRSETEVFDNRDCISAHLIITDGENNEPMGTARIYPLGTNTHIGEIAVRKKFRDTNYAELALRMLLYKAQQLSGKNIVAEVLEFEFPMYESFGFKAASATVDGKISVTVPSDDVHWHSECKDD